MLAPDSEVASSELPDAAADVLNRIRVRSPRVHCITNAVAQNFTANVLLALGAVPSMTISPDEIDGFITESDALLVNLGTFDSDRRNAAGIAIDRAKELDIPWLLDPVFVNRSEARLLYAQALVALRPEAIRLNTAELSALVGHEVDGTTLARFADRSGSVIGLTGETDIVFDKGRVAAISNGHELMAKVTAMGCATSAVIGACLAVESDSWVATASGLLMMAIAGEVAAARAAGPGSLAVRILDSLHSLDRSHLVERARVA